jgi:hypothetical protein
MSSGSASTTGPGRPEVATANARAMSSGIRSASSICAAHLASGAKNAVWSTSWKPSRPAASRATWPTSRSIGVESCRAVCTPLVACVAPGPRVTRHTPGRPVSFPYASAMFAAPPSWRVTTSRMGASCSASRTGR